MLELLKKLRASVKTGSTAAELRAALAGIDIPALQEKHRAAIKARDALLIGGTDRQVLDAEAAIQLARIEVDRAKAVKAELEQRIGEADVREAAEALTQERAEVDAAAQRAADKLHSRWPKLAAEMIVLLTEVETTDHAVTQVNEKLDKAGRGDERIEQPEWRARPRPAFGWVGAYSITAHVVLPAIEEWKTPGYRWRPGAMGAFTAPPQTHGSAEDFHGPVVAPKGVAFFLPTT